MQRFIYSPIQFLMGSFGYFLLAFLLGIFTFSEKLLAQDRTVVGFVRNTQTGEGIASASVYLKNGKIRTTSDDNGRFTLRIPQTEAGKEQTVIASFIGYKTAQKILPVGSSTLEIQLVSLNYVLQEVSVFSRPKKGKSDNIAEIDKAGSIGMQSETVQKTAGMFKEAFRTVQMMPGVSSNNELSARFNVRGGNQDENLVLVNGTQVFEPFHAKYAPQASIGVFNVDLIQSIDITTGGFSAQYGDRMSSVMNMQYREGAKDRVHGSVGLSFTNVDALLEGPLGNKGSFIVGARQSFLGPLVKLIRPQDQMDPSFYDVQGQINYDIASGHKLFFQFLQSGDKFLLDQRDTLSARGESSVRTTPVTWQQNDFGRNEVNSSYGNTILNLRSTNVFSSAAFLKTELSYYNQFDDENGRQTMSASWAGQSKNSHVAYFTQHERELQAKNQLTIRTMEARSMLDVQAASWYDVRIGGGYQNLRYLQNRSGFDRNNRITTVDRSPDTTRTAWNDTNTVRPEAIDVTSFKAFGFWENIFQITDELTLNVGGRADYFDINRDLNLSPRANVSYRTEGGTTLRAAWGWYYQSPLYQQLKYSYSSDSNTKAQRATHYILGLEQRISFDDDNGSLTAKLDGFYKKYDNLISYQRIFTSDIANPNSGPRYVRNNDAEGFAKGFDAMVTVAWRNLNFWVSYGYLDTQEDLLKDTIGFYPRFTDQRHSLAMVLDYKLGDGWSCGARFTYGSGQPYTPLQFDKVKQRWVETAPKNSVNYPAYQRVDVRVDKRFTIFGLDGFFFLDVNNVLNYDNVRNYSYSRDYDGNTTVNTNYLWPILPSFGLTINF